MIVAGSASPLLLASAAGGYNLTNSLRFRASASASLSRTPASAGNRRTWTYSTWVKRGALTTARPLLAGIVGGGQDVLYFATSDTIIFYQDGGSGSFLIASPLYRDPSAWYHIVVAVDTTQATESNRYKLYVNNVQVTNFGLATYPVQNYQGFINNNSDQKISTDLNGDYFDGYLTEVNFIDGQALTPSSFGENNEDTGVWQPKKYAGSYGTNGFYLPFTDNSALTTSSNVGLGKDFSGNGNYWTTNNISITAGSTYDSMTDVPTLTSETASNFAVLNPLQLSAEGALTEGNLTHKGTSSANTSACLATIPCKTGLWYSEFTVTGVNSTYPRIGVVDLAVVLANSSLGFYGFPGLASGVAYLPDGNKSTAGGASAYGATFTTGDVIGLAIDATNGAIYFSKNGTWQNSGVPTSGSSKTGAAYTYTGGSLDLNISTGVYNTSSGFNANFGQRPFAYTPPTGFVALNTFNLPTPTIGATASTQANKYFDATTYTGTGSTQSITNSGSMQPDFVWIKARSSSASNVLFDVLRGATKRLISNLTDSETTSATSLTSFNADGFTQGGQSQVGANAITYVAWQWRASNATAVTNTAGSITSTVSANTSAGFSVVTYTGTGANATVGHGLGVAPKMIIVKSRSAGGTFYDWAVYNSNIGAGNALLLNSTSGSFSKPSYWNSTTATSSVFSLGSDITVNQSGATYVAYCFSAVQGYSAMGSYTGNGSTDGVFTYLGFRPRFIMIKRTDAVANWTVYDTSRSPNNQVEIHLRPNTSGADDLGTSEAIDILSNGFKARGTSTQINVSGANYIYYAVAENPFKYSLGR
jgi:hypothetical protein